MPMQNNAIPCKILHDHFKYGIGHDHLLLGWQGWGGSNQRKTQFDNIDVDAKS